MSRKTLSVISLGCFRNTVDCEIVVSRFLDEGYILKDNYGSVDLLIVNTCGFIDKAKIESLEVIKEAVDLKKKGRVKKLLVFGCLIERYRKDLEKIFPQVDQWQGVESFRQKFTKRAKLSPPYVDFLKICEGCFNKCSYCAIPLIKGALRSKPKKEVLKEAKFLDKNGIKELNIIGQDITSWGKDLKEKGDLTALIKSILKETKNIRWIRLIYTHPKHVSSSLLDLIAKSERICKYIDLPIQHINDRILKLMNRGVTKKEIVDLIKKIREKIPDCTIRTSLIAGFPTEEEKEFEELLNFLKKIKFEKLGVFIYSREENTPAYNLSPQVHYRIKFRRFQQILALQRDIAKTANERFLGREVDVLVEEKQKDMFIGRSQYDAYEVDGAVFLKKKGLRIGEFYNAKIVDAYDYDLVGI